MGKQTAVIIERQFIDDEGKVVVFRQPEWKVACWDAIEALPDHDARSWALEKLLCEKYRARDEESRLEDALEPGTV